MAIQSKADVAYYHLAKELRDGRRAPGAAIVVKDAAGALKMTETPVREALERLVGQGAVINDGGRRGFSVPNMLPTDLADHLTFVEFVTIKASRMTAESRFASNIGGTYSLDGDAVSAIEALASSVAQACDSMLVMETVVRMDLILAPYRRLEPLVLPDWRVDIDRLHAAVSRQDFEDGIRQYTQRRISISSEFVEARSKSHRPSSNRFQI